MTDLDRSLDTSAASKPSGFIEHAVRSWRVWWTERHYSSALNTGLAQAWT